MQDCKSIPKLFLFTLLALNVGKNDKQSSPYPLDLVQTLSHSLCDGWNDAAVIFPVGRQSNSELQLVPRGDSIPGGSCHIRTASTPTRFVCAQSF